MDSTLTEHMLGQARSRDPGALRGVYDALAPAVLAYLSGKGCEDPEALTQDVFLTVFKSLDSIHGGVQGLRTFAFSVAHARMVDDTRRRHRQPATALLTPDADRRTAEPADEPVLASAAAESLLAGLSDAQREVLLLRVVADLSVEETAKLMGRTSGSVKTLQRRALQTLKERLSREEVTQ